MRRNSKYHVSVTSVGYREPQTLSVAIVGYENNDDSMDESALKESTEKVEKLVTLKEDENQIIEFDVSCVQKKISQCYFFFSTAQESTN